MARKLGNHAVPCCKCSSSVTYSICCAKCRPRTGHRTAQQYQLPLLLEQTLEEFSTSCTLKRNSLESKEKIAQLFTHPHSSQNRECLRVKHTVGKQTCVSAFIKAPQMRESTYLYSVSTPQSSLLTLLKEVTWYSPRSLNPECESPTVFNTQLHLHFWHSNISVAPNHVKGCLHSLQKKNKKYDEIYWHFPPRMKCSGETSREKVQNKSLCSVRVIRCTQLNSADLPAKSTSRKWLLIS